jgi:hypothetical protein
MTCAATWRDSAEDIRMKLEKDKTLTKAWLIGQLLQWGVREQKGLEGKKKDEVLGLVSDELNSGKVRFRDSGWRVLTNSRRIFEELAPT